MTRPLCTIVGAGEGLGRALAAKFASRKFDIALISRSKANSSAAIEAAAATAGAADVRFFPADAARPETLESAFATISREMGAIDLLIYNARGAFKLPLPAVAWDANGNRFSRSRTRLRRRPPDRARSSRRCRRAVGRRPPPRCASCSWCRARRGPSYRWSSWSRRPTSGSRSGPTVRSSGRSRCPGP